MILTGRSAGFDNNSGAGLVLLPTSGWSSWGSVAVGPGATIDIPFTVSSPVTSIDATLWWPETTTQTPNDVDLHLVNPSGTVVTVSVSTPSIFEKLHYSTAATGTWKLRIRGYSVTGTQTVFFSFFVHY